MNNNTEYKITLKKFWIHLSTICRHKFWVMYYCFKCGIPWRGLVHDLSKFSPTEFWTNVKYTVPGISPIEIQKKVEGFSISWQHHKGHNPHHYEYWMDRFDDGCYVARMPFEYSLEMLCDFLAAGKAYSKEKFTFAGEWSWWEKQKEIRNMHPDNTRFIDTVLFLLYKAEEESECDILIIKPSKDEKHDIYRWLNGLTIDKILDYEFLRSLYYFKVDPDTPTMVKIRQPKEEEK